MFLVLYLIDFQNINLSVAYKSSLLVSYEYYFKSLLTVTYNINLLFHSKYTKLRVLVFVWVFIEEVKKENKERLKKIGFKAKVSYIL